MNSVRLISALCLNGLGLSCISTSTNIAANPTDTVVSQPSSQSLSQPFVQHSIQQNGSIKIATWNVEHLAAPSHLGCKPRSQAEIAEMRAYAAKVDADIYAIQEVASIQALKLIFPEDNWQYILSNRANSPSYECRENGFTSTQQKVGFVVKRSIEVNDIKHVSQFGLDSPGLRYGLQVNVDTAYGATDILNLHMKSGCFVDDYSSSDREACETYGQQAPILEQWIAEREQASTPYVILGDFNHKLSAPYNQMTRKLLRDKRSTHITTSEIIGCHPRYPAPIDHIIVGAMDSQQVSASVEVLAYDNMQESAMLSDHCAVTAEIAGPSGPISAAVRWQTTSKEYQALSTQTYAQAMQALDTANLPSDWVVVMDVDETVLDNAPYQVEVESLRQGFSVKTWNAWVKRETAGLVPGAKDFIHKVFTKGGKVALITNRDKALDPHTWRNLLSVGVKVTPENTCLIGRSAQDKSAMGQKGIVNDKDLRRQQVRQGNPECSVVEGVKTTNWRQPHNIAFEVGDNIEDFSTVTQEDADITELLPKLGTTWFLLPNPMYGSWSK